eukprot:1161190-Pelagomonas_calceolata.AAC.6
MPVFEGAGRDPVDLKAGRQPKCFGPSALSKNGEVLDLRTDSPSASARIMPGMSVAELILCLDYMKELGVGSRARGGSMFVLAHHPKAMKEQGKGWMHFDALLLASSLYPHSGFPGAYLPPLP